MNDDAQLKLMAYVDGELPADEAAAIEAQLKTDREAADLVAELRWAAEAVSGNELELVVPESREFYWSKISQAIEFEARQAQRAVSRPIAKWWHKVLMPVAGMAALVFVFTFTLPNQQDGTVGEGAGSLTGAGSSLETAADVNVYEFYDERENMSVIWVTPGAETDPKSPQRDPLNQDDRF